MEQLNRLVWFDTGLEAMGYSHRMNNSPIHLKLTATICTHLLSVQWAACKRGEQAMGCAGSYPELQTTSASLVEAGEALRQEVNTTQQW